MFLIDPLFPNQLLLPFPDITFSMCGSSTLGHVSRSSVQSNLRDVTSRMAAVSCSGPKQGLVMMPCNVVSCHKEAFVIWPSVGTDDRRRDERLRTKP